jgi:hypothetical protein
VAIGKVVFTSREHIIGLEPRGKDLLGITLRYPYEVRDENDYFDDIPDEKTVGAPAFTISRYHETRIRGRSHPTYMYLAKHVIHCLYQHE